MKIIVDAMGGDNAPQAIVEGALIAQREFGCDIILVGQQDKIRPLLAGHAGGGVTVVHAADVIDMHDDAAYAVRRKKDASMSVALQMLANGEGDAIVSAGNSGALLSGATLVVKRIKGVRRAAFAPLLPTPNGGTLLIDSGANAECTPEFLLQFAFLGYLYMKNVVGRENPRVALVNNGAEEHKGTPLHQQAHVLMRAAGDNGDINFVGNVEGRDVLNQVCDVLVCDGFTGNILLKTVEGVAMFIIGTIREILKKNAKAKMAALAVKGDLGDLKNTLDYKEVGGAPMLGISKPVIKAHGSSDARAVRSAIKQAISFVQSGFVEEVERNIGRMTVEN